MSDNDHESGIVGGLMTGAVFTGLLLLPVAIMRRLGVPLTLVVSATVMTAFAIAHPAIAVWAAAEAAACTARLCPALSLHSAVGALPTWGWWGFAAMGWVLAFLFRVLRVAPPSSQDNMERVVQ